LNVETGPKLFHEVL